MNKQELPARRLRVLFLGAFPPPGRTIIGGNVSDCEALMRSSFPERAELQLLDSSQEQPPPGLVVRSARAGMRLVRFVQYVERDHPDALLVFASSGLSFVEKSLLIAYARARGVPGLLAVRSGHFMNLCRRSRTFRMIARPLLRAPALLLCQGSTWQQFYADVFGVDQRRTAVVENWVAGTELLDVGSRRRVGGSNPVQILFLGWVERAKGIEELVEAMALLCRDPGGANVHLFVAGNGSGRTAIERRAAELGIGDAITFTGWVTGDEKTRLLRECEILALPSHAEGLPNAMIEAMAAGMAVVATPVGSIPDVIRDGVNGFLVPPGDVDGLAAALRKLVDAPGTRRQFGERAHEVARTRFGVETAARALVELLCGAARKPRQRASTAAPFSTSVEPESHSPSVRGRTSR
jgi:glycosyltransferase involved in cell wall biosynthesis